MNSSSTELFLSRLHWPVTTLGYGRRIGIWFQGCSIRCPGCCSRDTWDAEPGRATTVAAVLEWIAAQPLEQIDGFTISGGEPFDQPAALHALLKALADLPQQAAKPRDVLVYSGYPWQRLQRRHPDILEMTDAIISEPYVQTKSPVGIAGSANQVVHTLSAIGLARHGPGAMLPVAPAMQAHFDGQQLWLIGIPQPGTLDALGERLAASGIALRDTSWRS